MRKYLVISSIVLILLLPFAGATTVLYENEAVKDSFTYLEQSFNHSVMVEYASMTTCGPCITASSQLYSIYDSGDLDFNYVTLIWDVGNLNVRDRLKELEVSSVPDVYFDGGFKRLLGAQGSEAPYRTAITQCGEREVPDIDIDVNVKWIGLGMLKITITVTNNEVEKFNGKIRTYIVEKESRWNDYGGNPYHYAALDIPIDKSLNLVKNSQFGQLSDTYSFSKTWFGAIWGFEDITKENIMVIASIFDGDSNYAVQSASAEPASNSNNLNFEYSSLFQIFEKFISHFPLFEQIINK
jgi:hypothetical protein